MEGLNRGCWLFLYCLKSLILNYDMVFKNLESYFIRFLNSFILFILFGPVFEPVTFEVAGPIQALDRLETSQGSRVGKHLKLFFLFPIKNGHLCVFGVDDLNSVNTAFLKAHFFRLESFSMKNRFASQKCCAINWRNTTRRIVFSRSRQNIGRKVNSPILVVALMPKDDLI